MNIREKHYVDKTLQLFIQTPTASGQIIRPADKPEAAIIGQAATMAADSNYGRINMPFPKIPVYKEESLIKKEDEEKTKVIKQTSAVKEEAKAIKEQPKIQEPAPEQKQVMEVKTEPAEQQLIGKQTEVQEKKVPDELTKILAEKDKLEKELAQLKKELTQSQKPVPLSGTTAEKPEIVKPELAPEKKEPTIKTVTAKTAVNLIGIPRLPQVPNIIMGVIKDMQGKILPNIILTVKDTNGVPHRALKTNRLGQFSTATPLQNSIYHIEAEDPLKRYVFDIAEINLSGKVFLPIEITAKGEKELMREKLTKEIFGNQGATV